jgi:acetyl-CoA carboxylase biotin carboxyl carrier protein
MSSEDAFEEVRVGLARLLNDLPRLPSALRVQARDVVIDLAWDTAAAPLDQLTRPVAPLPTDDALHVVAPTVGVFYRAAEPGGTPFVEVGAIVGPGDQVAIVEAMKLFLPVESASRGRVTAVLKKDGDPVEYGEPLIALEPVEG